MLPLDLTSIQTEILPASCIQGKNISIFVLRLDNIHPVISGNKWFKLQPYLEDAKNKNKTHIVTKGGAWSNHILATAAACQQLKLKCTGIIRGDEEAPLSITLKKAKESGMELIFLDRETFRSKTIPERFMSEGYYYIPEGGYGALGASGAATILDQCTVGNYSHICCAVGTGTMIAGLIKKSTDAQRVVGISVLKNNSSIENEVRSLTGEKNNWTILHDHHAGGYAKYSKELIGFMNRFFTASAIPTDFVYTGKLFFAIEQLNAGDYFPPGSKVLVIHSGGLQGNQSLEKGTLIF